MSRPRLLFVVESPFSERDRSRFGVDELSSDFEVTVIDVTPIVSPSIWTKLGQIQVVDERVVTAMTHAELIDLLASSDFAAVISILGIHEQRHAVHEVARRGDALSIELQLGTLPGDDLLAAHAVTKYTVRLKQLTHPLQSFELLLHKIRRRRYRVDVPDVVVYGGAAARRRLQGRVKRFIEAHSLDYDLFMERRDEHLDQSRESIAVYLDQDIGYHADHIHAELRSPIEPSSYYTELCEYLRHFETVTGLCVVVAPHPRADKNRVSDRFPGFRVSYEPTVELVRKSIGVLAHVSTAISFAVLWEKPLFLLGGEQLMRSWYGPYISAFATMLDRPILDTSRPDQSIPTDDSFAVNRIAYARYIHEHLSCRSDDGRRLWDIVGEAISQELSLRR